MRTETNSVSKSFDRRNFIKVAGIGVGTGILGLSHIGCKAGKESTKQVKPPEIQTCQRAGFPSPTGKFVLALSDTGCVNSDLLLDCRIILMLR